MHNTKRGKIRAFQNPLLSPRNISTMSIFNGVDHKTMEFARFRKHRATRLFEQFFVVGADHQYIQMAGSTECYARAH
jgi:hypothetical protein